MQWAGKAMDVVSRATNSNVVTNAFLVGAFVALSFRSSQQQKDIEALENEKSSLLQTNKHMKTSMRDWKQQLFAEAALDNSPVPLSTLKSIYGETSSITQPPGLDGAPVTEDPQSSSTKFVV